MTAIRIDDGSKLPTHVQSHPDGHYAILQKSSVVTLSRVEAQALVAVLTDFIDSPEGIKT